MRHKETKAERNLKNVAYQREVYVNPIRRIRNVSSLDAEALRRLDVVLLSEVPIALIEKRFGFSRPLLHARLRELGFRVGSVLNDVQERFPL